MWASQFTNFVYKQSGELVGYRSAIPLEPSFFQSLVENWSLYDSLNSFR